MKVLTKGIREYRKLLNTTSFASIEAVESLTRFPECDSLKFDSDDFWRCFIKYVSASLWHQSGTCKMGLENDPSSVVTSNLKVKGISGLRVIDASVIPQIVRGHTNAITIAIAEKGADIIKSEYPTILG